MKLNFKTVVNIALAIGILILTIRLYKVEKKSAEVDRLVKSGQLKCKKPH